METAFLLGSFSTAGRVEVRGLLLNRKEISLSKEALESLLGWLDTDRERAGEIFEQIRSGLMKFFECRGCPFYEEYAEESIYRAAERIRQGAASRPANPFVYFLGVAHNLLREYWKDQSKGAEGLDSIQPSRYPAVDPERAEQQRLEKIEMEQRLECLERCLTKLPAGDRTLLIEYHSNEKRKRIENREKMAEQLGITLIALRTRLHRLRERLESCIGNCINDFS
jgi:DNA-directed RNA polymerase specialized sigma24 family protein